MSQTPEREPYESRKRASSGPNGLLMLALVGVGMLVGILFLAWLGSPRTEPAVGKPLGRLDLRPLLYTDKSFSERDLAGKVTVLHFWGTWCPPCLLEFPEFAEAARAFKDDSQVQFVSISTTQGPEYDLDRLAAATKDFMEKQQTEVPTYADPAGMSRIQVGLLLPGGSLPYPSTFVVDRQGLVAGVWIGFTPGGMQEMVAKVRSLLESGAK